MPASKPIPDRIAALREKKEKLAARLNQLEAKAKKDASKRALTREIVVGRAVLAHLATDTEFADTIKTVLEVYVTRPADKESVRDILGASTAPALPRVRVPAPKMNPDASTERRAPAWGEMQD